MNIDFIDDVVDIKMIKDLNNRPLSIGEGEGGRGLMNRIVAAQECPSTSSG